jgi:uncharacterized protein (UPF0261 family)
MARAYVCGTLDSKGAELRYVRDLIEAAGIATTLVDLGTSGKESPADVTAAEVAAHHPGGAEAVFTGDRGTAVAAMAEAFRAFVLSRRALGGINGAGGSGNTSLLAPALRALPVGLPKLLVSTVASATWPLMSAPLTS